MFKIASEKRKDRKFVVHLCYIVDRGSSLRELLNNLTNLGSRCMAIACLTDMWLRAPLNTIKQITGLWPTVSTARSLRFLA